jgi:hypothetical protein
MMAPKLRASIYEMSDADYYVRYRWDGANQTWTREVIQTSPDPGSGYKILNMQHNYTDIFEKGQGYVQFSLDLGLINYPKQYTVLSSIDDDFTENGRTCELSDYSDWVSLPPPQYNTTISPSPLIIRPGEEKIVELKIKSDTDAVSQISLWTDETDDLELNLVPENVSLISSGLAVSTLFVKAAENMTPERIHSLNIHGDVSLPSLVIAGNEEFNNSQQADLPLNIPLSIKILRPLTFEEHLKSFSDSWITPISGMWSFLAGVAAVIAPLIIRWYGKKRNKKINEKSMI